MNGTLVKLMTSDAATASTKRTATSVLTTFSHARAISFTYAKHQTGKEDCCERTASFLHCAFSDELFLSSLLSAVQYMRFLLWRCVAVFLIVCTSAEGWYLKTDVSDDWITLNHRYEHAVTFRTLPFAEESNQTGMEVWTKYQIAWYASNARVQQIISVILMDWESIHIFLHLLIHIRLAWHSEINKLFVLFFFFFLFS